MKTRADALRERLHATEEALISSPSEGAARHALRQRFGVSTRSVQRWIKAVKALWKREGVREQRAAHRLEQRAMLRSTLRHILARSFAANDLRTATTVAGRLIELDGLDRAPEQDVNPEGLSGDELSRQLADALVGAAGGQTEAMRKIREVVS